MYYENGLFKIYYEKYGNGKQSILILPGWGHTRPTFYNLIEYLSRKYTVYIIDYPGFGNSFIKEKNLTIYDYTESIIELMEYCKIKNPIIISHSFGGRISTLLTGLHKIKIKKQILIDIAGIKPKKTFKSIIKTYTYKILKKLTNLLPKKKRLKLQDKLLKHFSSTDYYELPDNMKSTFKNIVNEDLTKYYKDINTKTLIIWGEYDHDTPLSNAYIIKKEISNSKLFILKGATHFSYLDYPYLIINIINKFIN